MRCLTACDYAMRSTAGKGGRENYVSRTALAGTWGLDGRDDVMNPYSMRDVDTMVVTVKGQGQFPVGWRRKAGLEKGGSLRVVEAHDGQDSLILTPIKRRGRGVPGLARLLRSFRAEWPTPPRHALPFK